MWRCLWRSFRQLPNLSPKTQSTSLHHIRFVLSAKMASRYRSFSKPAISMFSSTFNKPKSPSSFLGLGPSLRPTRRISQLGSLQSLPPLHSAVSSVSMLSQGMLSADPGSLASVYRDRIMRKGF